jgi:hypothetical protein
MKNKIHTLNTKYIWAVLIKLHDSATYDDRRKSYEWLKHQALKCNLSQNVHMTVHEKKSTLSIIRPRYSRLIFFYQSLQNV